jgi:hypothetical protein
MVTQVQDTKAALRRLFGLCAAESACAHHHSNLSQLWKRALARLDVTPLRGSATTSDGATASVLVDAGRLLRTVRFALGGDGPANVSAVPEMIDAAAHGRLDPRLATLVADDPVLCAGYRAQCPVASSFALGSFLSTFCRDQVPHVDSAAVQQATAGETGYGDLFAHDPYVAACRDWPVGQASVRSTPALPMPILLFSGSLDSFSSPGLAHRLASAQSHAWAVTVAGQTHNVLGFADCAISIRNAWTLHPLTPPNSTPCRHQPAPTLN